MKYVHGNDLNLDISLNNVFTTRQYKYYPLKNNNINKNIEPTIRETHGTDCNNITSTA